MSIRLAFQAIGSSYTIRRCSPGSTTTTSLLDLDSGEQLSVSLVFPAARASNESSVPVLSPLGLALLGCREGDVLEWQTREGTRRLRVDVVIYPPEAEGDFFI